MQNTVSSAAKVDLISPGLYDGIKKMEVAMDHPWIVGLRDTAIKKGNLKASR